ncbi:MAG: glucose sorbosone dehydrogenase [Candidatus Lokiarchaeota archaeon]|nr:glucose sorbosone dehydrogenase [Candidatus Lokiarchaeota archaeon]
MPSKKIILIILVVITSLIIVGISVPLIFIFLGNINQEYQASKAFPALQFNSPTGIYTSPDSTNRLFVLEQIGIIKVFNNSELANKSSIFLDLSSKVYSGGELGLLGLTFHPNFTENGYFYVYYTTTGPKSVISRFSINNSDINKGNITSEQIILEIAQPYPNHNGGQIAFGPEDGYLYIALEDGGNSGDPDGNAQNKSSLLGSILRIDIDSGSPYAIPNDNPFYGNSEGWREEVWAYGLRNPWRFSFDEQTSMLWAGDVGQNSWEEINIIEKGKNYGWNIMEGEHCYLSDNCNTTGLQNPIFEYNHQFGNSITGGFIYRGTLLDPILTGKYIYGDYGQGKIWALEYESGSVKSNSLIIYTALAISSFGIDKQNELYFCSMDGYIYQIEYLS